jgi:hypothetical protein
MRTIPTFVLGTSCWLLLATATSLCGALPPQDRKMPRPEGREPRPLTLPPRDSSSNPSSGLGAGRSDSWGRPNFFPEGREPIQRRRVSPDLAPAVTRVDTYAGTRTIVPPAWNRCGAFPSSAYWQHRDLFDEIKWLSRQGFIPVNAVSDDQQTLEGVALFPAGWRAYGFVVPAKGSLHLRLHHSNEGWFRLLMSNKWGDLEAGMLKNVIYTGNPEVSYTNPKNSPRAVYVIVDDPGWMSSESNPYKLEITRDWDPATADTRGVKLVQGIWGAQPSVSAEFRGPSWSGPATR